MSTKIKPVTRQGMKWLSDEPVPPAKYGRRCRKCNCLLSVYNTSKLCQPCTKGLILAGIEPDDWKGGD
jgi:hypothetical protein